VINLSQNIQILREHAEYIFDRINRTIEGLSDNEITWSPTEVSNSIEWTLNHMARLSNLSIPRIIKGDPEFIPEGWPEDYREQSHTLEKLLGDIEEGKAMVLEGLGNMTMEDLEEELPLWGGTRKRKTGLFAYLGELVHHNGQIAYLKGTINRLKERDPDFLK
jgi:uncharacterized damage-inducible protein DinB